MAQNNQNASQEAINEAIEGTVQQDANGAPCTIVNSDVVQNILAPITIEKPAAGDSAEITVQPGQQYFFEFTEDAASSYVQKDGNLEISFEDGSQITLINFGEATIADLPATFAFSTLLNNDDIVVAEQIIETVPAQDELEEPQAEIRETAPAIEETTAQAEPAQTPAQQVASIEPAAGDDIAQQLASLEPAAGEAAGGSEGRGFGFQSSFTAGPITPLEDVGPIDPTALSFDLPEVETDLLIFDEDPTAPVNSIPVIAAPDAQNVDETNLGPISVSDTIDADFGTDGPGTFCVKTTGDNFSSDPAALTSGNEAITIETIGDTIIVGTLPNGDEAFRFEITDINTGAYTFTQNVVLDHPDATDPDDIIPLNFVVVAKDADGDTAETTVTINVADDGPAPNARDERTVDEDDLPGITINDTIDVDFGQDGAGEITANDIFRASGSIANDDPNSETDLSSEGSDVTVNLNAAGNTYTGTDENGTIVFTLQITDPATGAYAFTLNQPLDHADPNDPNDIITLSFGVDVTDFDGDSEPGEIVINVLDSAPVFGGDPVENVDEDNIGSAAASVTGDIDVSSVGSFTLTPDGSNGFSGSAANGQLTSNGNDVIVNQTATGYEGVADGETVFTLVIDSDNEEFTFTLLEPLDHADGTDANDEIQLTFGVLVTDGNGNTDNTTIKVDVLDSAPSISGSNSVDESDADFDNGVFTSITGNAVTDFGQDGEATVNAITPSSAASFRTEGSVETGTLRHDGIEIDVTLNGDTYTGTAGTVEVFTLTLNTDGSYEFTLKESLDHADRSDPNDVIDLFFGANITDFDGDTTTGEIQISVFDDGPTFLGFTSPTNPGPVTAAPLSLAAFAAAPVAAAATTSNSGTAASFADIDESTLENGPQSFDGSLNVDFGNDAPGTILANDTTSFDGTLNGTTLTSGGEEIEITSNATNDIYTGTTESGDVAFTLQITDIENGAYTFTQNLPLDHADDIITINFGVRATDNDGDFVDGAIAVTIGDDVLIIADSAGDVDESNLDVNDEITFEGKLDIEDINAISNISLDGNFEVLSNGNAVTLTSGKAEVTTQLDGTTIFRGTDSGAAVFTLEIAQDGTFTYTQFLQFGHFDANDENDILQLNFGVNITDTDGDVTNSTITINVADDAPVVQEDVNGAEEGQTITGDVLSNDDLGVDSRGEAPGFPYVKDITFEGQTFDLTTGPATIVTSLGTLIMNGDGTYEFTATDQGDPDGTVVFTYTATESFDVNNNDTASTTLSIRVTPDGAPVADNAEMTVDETDFKNPPVLGEDETTGNLNINFGIDGPGTVTPNDEINIIGVDSISGLTSGGDPVDVRATSNGYEAVNTVTNEQIFTLTVENDGAFDFDLLGTLDHTDPTDPNDNIRFEFGFEVTDGDGDEVQTQIAINVRDDAPVAIDDTGLTAIEGTPISGNVLDNDIESEDSPNTVVAISFNGVETAIPAAGTTISGNFGTLQIGQNGAYTYTPNTNNPNGTDIFTYTLQDSEGDQDTAEIEINVTAINDTPLPTAQTENVDEDNLDISEPGVIPVDFGRDAPGTFCVKTTGTNFTSSVGTLRSGGDLVTILTQGDTAIIGLVGTLEIFRFEITDTDTGTYLYTQTAPLDHPDATNPNDVIALNFTVVAKDADGDESEAIVTINVADSGPIADNDTNIVDAGGNVPGDLLENDETGQDTPASITVEGTQITANGTTINGQFGVLTIDPNGEYTYQANTITPGGTETFDYVLTDFDGDSDPATLTITVNASNDVPEARDDEKTVNDGSPVSDNVFDNDDKGDDTPTTVTRVQFGSTIVNVPSTGSVNIEGNSGTLTISADGEYTYQSNENDVADTATDFFTYTITDNNGDSDTATLAITVVDNDGPIAVDDSASVADGASIPGEVISNDTVGVDAPGIINAIRLDNGSFVSIPSTGRTITGDLGTLTIQQDGSYTYTANNNNPGGVDEFVYRLVDNDGDAATASLRITVGSDDRPDARNDSATVNDGETIDTRNVLDNDDRGNDTPTVVSQIKFGNNTVNVPANGSAKINGQFGELTIFSNGEYEYTANENQITTSATDTFTYTIRDADGDPDSANLVITIVDNDAPVARDDSAEVEESKTTSGNVITQGSGKDTVGADEPGTITMIDGQNIGTSGITVNGDLGTLTIQQDGSYTYTANDDNPHGEDSFTYKLVDNDGDSDTATLTINVSPIDDRPEFTHLPDRTVDETNLNINATGQIRADFGTDGPGTFAGTGSFTSDGSQTANNLSHRGEDITVSFSNGTYTAKTSTNKTVFTVKINSDGTYTYTQTRSLDHKDKNNANDIINLKFGVQARDADGDTTNGTFIIRVKDDAPVAVNDFLTNADGTVRVITGSVSGFVRGNDDFSNDSPNRVTKISFGTETKDIAEGQTVTINGASGTLTIDFNGKYTFTQSTPGMGVTIPQTRNEFTYTLTDGDGDSDTAKLVINTARVSGPIDFGGRDTPLVIDIDQDGIELVSKENGVLFDLGPDGILDQTGWVAADDGFLALDRNNDGIINDHSELFGSRTEDGFTILARHDSNNDGIIDANDDVFEDLVVWQDLNQNGYSEADELNGLEIYGIKSIDLDAEDSDEVIAGNDIILDGRLTYEDGSEGDIVDAVFKTEALDVLYGNEGADTFTFDGITENPTQINDFNAEEGDRIDLSALIDNTNDVDAAIQDFVHADQQGENTVVSITSNGESHAVAVLEGVTGLNIENIVKETIAA